MGYKVAVAGATGAVGREMLQTLSERNFPADCNSSAAPLVSSGFNTYRASATSAAASSQGGGALSQLRYQSETAGKQ